jgi:hypothetical protein
MNHYQTELLKVINYWKNSDLIENEWYFENFRQNFIDNLSSAKAFENLDFTMGYLLAETDESTAVEILQTLINLAVRSDTTQIPEIILENYHQLSLKFSDVYYQSKVLELLDYYRLGINEQIIFENR